MVYNFGGERVLEPKGYIPTAAWKLDNSHSISDKEMRIRVDTIKIEEWNFRQLCNECNYDKKLIGDKIQELVKKRGKMHNPITDSAGICFGTVDEIGREYNNKGGLKPGDKVICTTSLTSIPLYLEEVVEIDFNYAQIKVKGFAVVFGSSTVRPVPKNLEIPYTLIAMDEVGSLKKAFMLMRKSKRILILGDGLLHILLYAAVARRAVKDEGYVIAVMDKGCMLNLNKKDINDVLDPYVDNLYFTDILQHTESFEYFSDMEPQEFDLSINCANMLGGEVLSVMLTKDKGKVFFTSLISNFNTAVLFAESLGKDLEMIAIEEFTEGFVEFTEELVKSILPDISKVERIYDSNKLIRQLPITASDMMMEKKMKRVDGFMFGSEKTKQMLTEVLNIASYDCNVIIEGETGVGKEKILEVIYKNSSRRFNPCVKINCATIHENLAESEIFGYEPNSFTGAGSRGKPGYFEMANSGILFLDEIGTMSLNLQGKLLRVLQEKQFYRIGGEKPINVDVRVICANNVPLRELVSRGEFRRDLYYRLSVCEIHVPPLRERPDDIICLANSFLKEYNAQYSTNKSLGRDGEETLARYIWPGNVRELDNVIHRLVVNVKENMIMENDVILAIKNRFSDSAGADDENIELRERGLHATMGDYERDIIAKALKEEGSTRAAARALGISQSQLMRKKKKYEL